MNLLPRWPQTAILPSSDFQVARITGVSCKHLASLHFLKHYINGIIQYVLLCSTSFT
jgi:hypothetical protein